MPPRFEEIWGNNKQFPEYNPTGDWANGMSGSVTPASSANAANQAKSTGNPFTDVLNHVSAFNRAMQPGIVPEKKQVNPYAQQLIAAPDQTSGPTQFTGAGDYGMPGGSPGPTASFLDQPGGGGPVDSGGGGAIPSGGGIPPAAPPVTAAPDGGSRNRPVAPVTPQQDPMHFSPSGVPWGPDNMPPKPPNTEDQNVAAQWYAQHNFLDPTLANVTGQDVGNYRTSGYQGDFLSWWKAGKPVPAQAPAAPTQPPYSPWVDPGFQQPTEPPRPGAPGTGPPPAGAPGSGFDERGNPLPPVSPSPPPAPPPASGVPPHVAVGGPPPTPDPNAAPPGGAPPDEIQRLIDTFNQGKNVKEPGVEDLLNPMFKRQRQNTINDLRSAASSTPGRLQSGGYGANEADAVSNISGQQSAALAGAKSQEYLARIEQETKYRELATQAGMQKYVTDINADLTRLGIKTNADLQKWLSSEDNALKKYGIDSNDVLQRYLADMQLKGVQIGADASISAASLHAAATQAAAAASSASGAYSANKQFELGMAGLGVDREKNIGNFIISLMNLGITNFGDLNNILTGIPPGSVVVKP